MKTLVIIHQYFNFPSETGSTRTYHFAQIMRSRGWRVIVVSGVLDHGTKKKTGVFKKDGLTIIRRQINFANKDKFYIRIVKFMIFSVFAFAALLRIRSKIVFISSTPLTIVIPALLYKCITGNRYTLEVRDVWPEVPVALGVLRNRLLIKLSKVLEYLAYKNASAIVALSSGMSTSILRTCSKVTPIVVPNGVNAQAEMFVESIDDMMPKRVLDILNNRKEFMCYTGTFGHVNDMVFMTELMIAYTSKNSEIHFVLLGTGQEFEICKSLVERAGQKDRIIILPQSSKQVAFLITEKAIASFCFVRPIAELFNNSANKVPESLGLGTPVILNYQGWQSELLDEHNLSFVVKSRDISQACSELTSIHEMLAGTHRSSLKKRCQKLAYEAFDLNKTFEPVVQKLEEMCDEI